MAKPSSSRAIARRKTSGEHTQNRTISLDFAHINVLLCWATSKSSSFPTVNDPQLIHYLQQDLALALVTRQQQPTMTELPIVLWNHGLISLEQLGSLFDWMEGMAV
jgi:hypothetical protein